ncbi:MAG: PspC domain-containing protein, partial [Nanoarchaeota archaeon]
MINTLGFAFLGLFAVVFSLFLFGFWVWALVDCLKSNRESGEKLVWALVIIFLNVLGALIYTIVGRTPKTNRTTHRSKKTSTDSKLVRDTDNAMIAGVCAGLAKMLKMDVTLMRLLWVIMTIMTSGFGLVLYV